MKIDHDANGVSYRQFDHWCRQGWIKADSPSGSGHDRNFPESEVRIFTMMAKLIYIGFRPAVAADLARLHIDKEYNSTLEIFRGELSGTGVLSPRGYSTRGQSPSAGVLDECGTGRA